MFEAAELGHRLTRHAFASREPDIHAGLLGVQRRLLDADFPVLIVVAGVEGAGKGEVVSLLHRWMDARGLEVHAFWDETDEERLRPRYWRFWRALPAKGRVSILFGSWYTQPIVERVLRRARRDHFDRELERIRHFEDMLIDDGALIIKLWFHLTRKAQRRRLARDAERDGRLSPLSRASGDYYQRYCAAAERALRKTDVGHSPWHIIEARDRRYRDVRTGEIVTERIRARLEQGPPHSGRVTISSPIMSRPGEPGVLARVALDRQLDEARYRKHLRKYSDRLYELAWTAHRRGINTVAVFEGWDAAGKGSAIRRVIQAMDARLYRVISTAAPSDEEQSHHYLWRFWRHLPRAGYHTLYDRSWYGRVLVERVEGLASALAWQRAYHEINSFEEQLIDHGTVVIKFWLHIDQAEQLRRFREREQVPWKQYKMTGEDWRNRARWADYEAAVTDMVVHTSTALAPWTLVAANDKRHARIEVLRTYCERLAAALD